MLNHMDSVIDINSHAPLIIVFNSGIQFEEMQRQEPPSQNTSGFCLFHLVHPFVLFC